MTGLTQLTVIGERREEDKGTKGTEGGKKKDS
jgi:hypothetical protein